MFGLAETDEALEKMIKTFIIPVIMKMSSEYKTVKDKVCLMLCTAILTYKHHLILILHVTCVIHSFIMCTKDDCEH